MPKRKRQEPRELWRDLPVLLPRRVRFKDRPKQRIRCAFVNDPQSELPAEVERKQRFMKRLIGIMGLSRDYRRIELARDYITLAKTRPQWSKRFDTNRLDVRLALDQPYDLIFNEDFYVGSNSEYTFANEAMMYIWLNETWPQEATQITCICGLPDEVCDDSCM